MFTAISKGFFISVICFLFVGCTGSTGNKDQVGDVSTKDNSHTPDTNAYDYYVSGIPFPFKLLKAVSRAQAPFNIQVLNPPANASKYNEMNYKAINLGIYGADIAYIVTCSQFPELNVYLKAGSRLAELLGVPSSFSDEILEKYTQYHDEKDTLINLVYNSYKMVDESLVSSEQGIFAAYIITGCWVEAMYLTTQAIVKPENKRDLLNDVWEQRFFVTNILNLLNKYNADKFHMELSLKLNEIKVILNEAQSKDDFNDQQLFRLKLVTQQLRGKLTDAILI